MPHPEDGALPAAYREKIARGELREDAAQRIILERLETLLRDVANHRVASKKSSLGWLFAKREKQPVPRGVYIYGSVGRGKTMLMDLFFAHVPAHRKRRAHFNDFMADVHERIHAHRQKLKRGETKETDPVPPVAADLFSQAWVLCFDEFSVTDIADAMLLSRLFEQLFSLGCVLVATSNVAPDDLYRDGLNRQLFLPFISLLKANADIMNLDAPTDYRLEKIGGLPVFHLIGSDGDNSGMDEAWRQVVDGRSVSEDQIERKGRTIAVPHSVPGAARFSFSELCDAPLGAADYIAIVERYPTLFIDRIPKIGKDVRNAAKRFITLIDVLYDHGARLFFSADVPVDQIYTEGTGNEAFEFERTVSRLIEMQSKDYLSASSSSDQTG